jgi:hypothetical protein
LSNHYQIRVIIFVFWIDTTWGGGDNIVVKINSTQILKSNNGQTYGCASCIQVTNQCGVSSELETG